jgi:hypothetical protein
LGFENLGFVQLLPELPLLKVESNFARLDFIRLVLKALLMEQVDLA